ncbi:hypothetical protein KGQ71_01215 [Patescibacteria group bacterium]|nr:hypothetical protein [Patescibacteria group bacterium]
MSAGELPYPISKPAIRLEDRSPLLSQGDVFFRWSQIIRDLERVKDRITQEVARLSRQLEERHQPKDEEGLEQVKRQLSEVQNFIKEWGNLDRTVNNPKAYRSPIMDEAKASELQKFIKQIDSWLARFNTPLSAPLIPERITMEQNPD